MALWFLVVAFMMISRIPTYSFKLVRVKREMVLPVLVIVGVVAAVLASYPWLVFSVLGVLYLSSIPFSYRAHKRFVKTQMGVEETRVPAREASTEIIGETDNKELL